MGKMRLLKVFNTKEEAESFMKQEKIYLIPGEKAPEGAIEYVDPRKGRFYESSSIRKINFVEDILSKKDFEDFLYNATRFGKESSAKELIDFLNFYCKLSSPEIQVSDEEIENIVKKIQPKIKAHYIYLQFLADKAEKGKYPNWAAEWRNLSVKLENIFQQLESPQRLDKVIAIDSLVSLQHTSEPTVLPQIFGFGIGESQQLQDQIKKVLNYLASEEPKMEKSFQEIRNQVRKQTGILPFPEENKDNRDIEKPVEVPFDYQQKIKYEQQKIIEQKAFPKMYEGEQAHESRLDLLENKNKIGETQEPIIGKSNYKQVQKAAFSPEAPKVRIGEKQEEIDIEKDFEYTMPFPQERQTSPETENQQTAPKKATEKDRIKEGADVEENLEAYYKSFNWENIYDSLDNLLQKDWRLIPKESTVPRGAKDLGAKIEYSIYHSFRDVINSWFNGVNKDTLPDDAIIDLKKNLIKWQIDASRNTLDDAYSLFEKGINAGIKQTGIEFPEKYYGEINWQYFRETGMPPAIENFQNEVFDNISDIVRKHYHPKIGHALYREKRDIDSYLHKSRFMTERMVRTEAAKLSNYGILKAWDKDEEKHMYKYYWNNPGDARSKKISKLRMSYNPLSYDEAKYLWEHQKQLLDNVWYNDQFNQRCSLSRGQRLEKEFIQNRFIEQEAQFRRTS